MKNVIVPLIGLILAGVGNVSPSALAQVSSVVVVRGTVANAATKLNLEGARVAILESGKETRTGRDGSFVLYDVPVGSQTLMVSYPGLDDLRQSVTARAPETIVPTVELSAAVYEMESFTVASVREGTAAAIAQQQAALNAKNVVAADTFGEHADGNVGDFLQKLPGIYSESVGSNVRSFVVRGIDSALNSVTLDGTKMADSQSSGLSRSFELDAVSLTNLDQLEVIKAPTPDMEADSIGGTVNLVSKSAFRQRGRSVSYSLGAATQLGNLINYRDKFGRMGSLQYADTFGEERKLGAVLALSYHHQPGGGSEVSQIFQPVATSPAYTTRVGAPEADGVPTIRFASSIKLEYRFGPDTILSLAVFNNEMRQSADTRRLQYIAAASGIVPGYTDLVSEARPIASTAATLFTNVNDKYTKKSGFSPGFRHRNGNWHFDAGLSYSTAESEYVAESHDKGIYNARLTNIGWRVDRSESLRFPEVTQTAGPDIYNLNNWRSLDFTFQERHQKEDIIGAHANLRRDYVIGGGQFQGYLKAGLKFRSQERNRDYRGKRFEYAGPNGVIGDADDGLERFRDLRDQNFRTGRYSPAPWLNPSIIAASIRNEPEQWREDVAHGIVYSAQNSKRIKEEVSAAYLMAKIAYMRASGILGVRFEETADVGTGLRREVTPEEAARRASFQGPLTPEEIRRRTVAEYGGKETRRGSYSNVFPGVHLRYDVTQGLVLRASATTSIGRPDFASIIPNFNVDYDRQTITATNTDLKPQFSENYDLSVEYYIQPSGLLSIGAFRKNITDFIFSTRGTYIGSGQNNGFNGEYEGFELISSANGGSASVEGLELSYMQQLSFLPGWLSGFGAYANYTRLITRGNYGGTGELTSSELAGFMPKTGNLGISYVGFGLDLRVQANWRPVYLQSFSANPVQRIYNYDTTSLDIKFKYAFRPWLAVFCNIDNVTDEPAVARFRGFENRPADIRYDGPKLSFGVSGRF